MGVKCLGTVTIEPPGLDELILAAHDDTESKRNISAIDYFRLGKKIYVPISQKGEIDQSEKRCEKALERSKEGPQQVGEVTGLRTYSKNMSINSTMLNRIWLYDSKVYQSTRNDFSQEQIHLLILSLIEKEKAKFKELEGKFKNK